MKNGFVHEGEGLRYYVDDIPVKGWFKIDGDWFYFNSDGIMSTGFCKIGSTTYYFDSYGKCILFKDRIEKEQHKKLKFKEYVAFILKGGRRK